MLNIAGMSTIQFCAYYVILKTLRDPQFKVGNWMKKEEKKRIKLDLLMEYKRWSISSVMLIIFVFLNLIFFVSLIWLGCKIKHGQWTELWATTQEAKIIIDRLVLASWSSDLFSFTKRTRVLNTWNAYYHLQHH